MNLNTLLHPVTLLKIGHAIRNCSSWGIDHIRNKQGKAYIAVRYRSGKVVGKPFQFLDRTGKDISEIVYKAIRIPTIKAINSHIEWRG